MLDQQLNEISGSEVVTVEVAGVMICSHVRGYHHLTHSVLLVCSALRWNL